MRADSFVSQSAVSTTSQRHLTSRPTSPRLPPTLPKATRIQTQLLRIQTRVQPCQRQPRRNSNSAPNIATTTNTPRAALTQSHARPQQPLHRSSQIRIRTRVQTRNMRQPTTSAPTPTNEAQGSPHTNSQCHTLPSSQRAFPSQPGPTPISGEPHHGDWMCMFRLL